ncbi:RNase P modulator RnpM [Spiroplasma endosymbiont of Crioceris asparagi]|uniref:RNase P modulator RnpM n=1 Tax=Spiroplasma endosymbiont of Crioceris asparagi TaxID=3066286 RepID=UPI0030CB257D
MKHKVLRKDVSTNTMLPKVELIRVVKNKNGEIFVDQTQKANGRGVYLRANLEALAIVKKQRLLEKGLKTKIGEEVFLMIEKEIKENWM